MKHSLVMYGGAFNPPHLDHTRIIAQLLEHLADSVLIVPTGKRYDKAYSGVTETDRERMVRLAVEDFGDAVTIDTMFLHGSGETTTLGQAKYLREKYGREIPQVFGSDTIPNMREWDPTGFVATQLPKVFIRRPGFPFETGSVLNFDTLEFESAGYSSTEIRNEITKLDPRDLDTEKLESMLHAKVLDFIMKHQIYFPNDTPVA